MNSGDVPDIFSPEMRAAAVARRSLERTYLWRPRLRFSHVSVWPTDHHDFLLIGTCRTTVVDTTNGSGGRTLWARGASISTANRAGALHSAEGICVSVPEA